MRKFMEASVGKEASFVDGVKISINKNSWILMLPDQHSDFLNIYIQAESMEAGEEIFNEYAAKIAEWIRENEHRGQKKAVSGFYVAYAPAVL